MFIQKYVNEIFWIQILDTYEITFLRSLNERKFLEIYRLLLSQNFYFIEDIILKYLEIFSLDYQTIVTGLAQLKLKLGEDYVARIGQDMSHLNELAEKVNY